MMESYVVNPAAKEYQLDTIYSEEVVVRSNAAVEGAKAGHPLFWNATNEAFEAFPVNTELTGKTGAVVILLEDIDIPKYTAAVAEPLAAATGEITVRAIVSGNVYKDFVRTAGITEEYLPDNAFAALEGRILFLEIENYGDLAEKTEEEED